MLMMVSGGHSPAIDCHYLLLTANGCQLDGSGTLSYSGVLEAFPSLPFLTRTMTSSSQALSSTPKALRELKREYMTAVRTAASSSTGCRRSQGVLPLLLREQRHWREVRHHAGFRHLNRG